MTTKSKITRHWIQMGVELEGGWDAESRSIICARVPGSKVQHDGSVKIRGALDLGEVTTKPHTTLDAVCADIEVLHPEKVNNTCGYHIHTSHSAIDYSALCSRDFWDYFRARWKAWGLKMVNEFSNDERMRFWERYEGRNPGERQYCKAEFDPVNQLIQDDHRDKRYTQLNFAAWHKYKTLEIRMLPMFANKAITLAATREWSDILDTFLSEYSFPPIEINAEFGLVDDVMTETVTMSYDISSWEENEEKPAHKPLQVGPGILYHIPGAEQFMRPWVETLDEAHE
jgi:hypothetical protein